LDVARFMDEQRKINTILKVNRCKSLLAFFSCGRILKENTVNKLLSEIKKVWKLKGNQRKGYYDIYIFTIYKSFCLCKLK